MKKTRHSNCAVLSHHNQQLGKATPQVDGEFVNAGTLDLENPIVSAIRLAQILHSNSNCIQSRKNANHHKFHPAKFGERAGTEPGLEIIHCLHIVTRSNYQATLVPRRTGCLATYQQGIFRRWCARISYYRGWTKARVSLTMIVPKPVMFSFQITLKSCHPIHWADIYQME